MKQGETRRKQPKDKHTKLSWQKRNKDRAGKQELHAATVIANEEAAAQHAAEVAAAAALLQAEGIRTADYYREEGDPLRVEVDAFSDTVTE